jgi:heat shock protein HspQ
MTIAAAKFEVGQVIRHRKFDYRGVVYDIDPCFQGSDAWYEQVATSRPPKDQPWYHVLVHDAAHTTYVAERHLEPDDGGDPIRHELIGDLFSAFENGRYRSVRSIN